MPNSSIANDPARSPDVKSDQQKQQFRAMIEPLVHRARQLGLNRVQIREIITSLL
jgi:DNA-binding transcriptional regulator YhcF (GntR family)